MNDAKPETAALCFWPSDVAGGMVAGEVEAKFTVSRAQGLLTSS